LIPSYVFVDQESALRWIDQATFPKVFKLRCGAGSQNVELVRTRDGAVRKCRRMFGRGYSGQPASYFADLRRKVRRTTGWKHFWEKLGRMPQSLRTIWNSKRYLPPQRGYMYFQDFLDGNAHDTRVTVIGGRAFAFLRKNRPGDFRASGSGDLVYDPGQIDPRCVRAAQDATRAIGAQSLAFDFLFDSGGQPRIGEISYTYAPGAVYDCLGYWDEGLCWREGHYWPQDLVLEDIVRGITGREGGVK
jgi:hypothetical protein